MAKKTWQDRLVKEEKKLDLKVEALASFIEGEYGKFDELPESDRDLLMAQHAAMTTYLNILAVRMKKHNLMECETCLKKKEAFAKFIEAMISQSESTDEKEEDDRKEK